MNRFFLLSLFYFTWISSRAAEVPAEGQKLEVVSPNIIFYYEKISSDYLDKTDPLTEEYRLNILLQVFINRLDEDGAFEYRNELLPYLRKLVKTLSSKNNRTDVAYSFYKLYMLDVVGRTQYNKMTIELDDVENVSKIREIMAVSQSGSTIFDSDFQLRCLLMATYAGYNMPHKYENLLEDVDKMITSKVADEFSKQLAHSAKFLLTLKPKNNDSAIAALKYFHDVMLPIYKTNGVQVGPFNLFHPYVTYKEVIANVKSVEISYYGGPAKVPTLETMKY